jgi:hypothetical protein
LIAFKLGKEGRNVKIFIIPDSRWQFWKLKLRNYTFSKDDNELIEKLI